MSEYRLYRVLRDAEGKHVGNEYMGVLVTCKECKKWHDWGDGECFCGRFEGGIGCSADDFCSYGEREGE